MKCPFCDELEDKVVDSRMAKEGEVIRRRRECIGCHRRYTTYERVEEILPVVVKKDGRRESFDRSKILSGIKKACEKYAGRYQHDEAFVGICNALMEVEELNEKDQQEILTQLQDLLSVRKVDSSGGTGLWFSDRRKINR